MVDEAEKGEKEGMEEEEEEKKSRNERMLLLRHWEPTSLPANTLVTVTRWGSAGLASNHSTPLYSL